MYPDAATDPGVKEDEKPMAIPFPEKSENATPPAAPKKTGANGDGKSRIKPPAAKG